MTKTNIKKNEREIAYFTMEIGLESAIPTYSGGLGVLAGDTIKACADLNVPLVGITLLHEEGYFRQKLDEQGRQTALSVKWDKRSCMELMPAMVPVEIEGRRVLIQAWEYIIHGYSGYEIPVYFLDTDVIGNEEQDKQLTRQLYGGDLAYRLKQEIVLGIGGVRMLAALGYTKLERYHMNEGHAALLTLELLNTIERDDETGAAHDKHIEHVRQQCLFTTHTPVEAGHDHFPLDLVGRTLTDIPMPLIEQFQHEGELHLTYLALDLSHYVNGVAKKHGEVSRRMFPGYSIDSITNGVHSATWTSRSFVRLYDQYIPGWQGDSYSLRYAVGIPEGELWQAHQEAKRYLCEFIALTTGKQLREDVFTIGFARRMTAYKRAQLLLSDPTRLQQLATKYGGLQIVYAGKAHPRDIQGQEIIQKIVGMSKQLGSAVQLVYLENYSMEIGLMMTSGVDLWLNTPLPPREASGTSGMKSAHNGVPQLSVLDGWWIEGCIEGVTGWAINSLRGQADTAQEELHDIEDLYRMLDEVIIPMYRTDPSRWQKIMKNCIVLNASFFNTHRMVQQYVVKAYL
jgi:starch phosphorylase